MDSLYYEDTLSETEEAPIEAVATPSPVPTASRSKQNHLADIKEAVYAKVINQRPYHTLFADIEEVLQQGGNLTPLLDELEDLLDQDFL